MTLREFMKLVEFGPAVSVYLYDQQVFPDDEENKYFDFHVNRIGIVSEDELFVEIF